jgi:hypothetical protein
LKDIPRISTNAPGAEPATVNHILNGNEVATKPSKKWVESITGIGAC